MKIQNLYIVGDLHAGETCLGISKRQFNPELNSAVICTGDFGGVWYHNYHTNPKARRVENFFLEKTLNPKVLWLAVDGNHENFARLYTEFQEVTIFGGKAYKIRENVYYLKRGEIFELNDQKFFVFGGALSTDKEPRPSVAPYGRPWRGRTEGIDWWPEEIPSELDVSNALKNLEKHSWDVDHVITHTCPISARWVVQKFRESKNDPTERILQDFIDRGLNFKQWHFGHFHTELAFDKFICHSEKVHRLSKKLTHQDYEHVFRRL